jgi:hypothetical protein
VAGGSENCNEFSGSISGGEFLDCQRDLDIQEIVTVELLKLAHLKEKGR